MAVNQQVNEDVVIRRAEMVSTRPTHYSSTEQYTRDIAMEHRLLSFKIMWIILATLGVLETLLGLRFFLKLVAANTESRFADMIYGLSGGFIAPFSGLVTAPILGTLVLEMSTPIAMVVYGLFFLIFVGVIGIMVDHTSSRTATRLVHEKMLDGSDRTVQTTKIG